jgi:hypothetical protein
MSIDKDDPRLTAYALDEMNPGEKEAFEKEIAGDAVAKAEIEAILATASRVKAELATEAAPGLDQSQRIAVTRAAGRRRGRILRWGVAAAACLPVGLFVYQLATPRESIELHDLESRENVRDELAVGRNERIAGKRDKTPVVQKTRPEREPQFHGPKVGLGAGGKSGSREEVAVAKISVPGDSPRLPRGARAPRGRGPRRPAALPHGGL